MSFTDDSHLQLLHKQSQLFTSRLLKRSSPAAKGLAFPPAPTEAEQPVIPHPNVFHTLTVDLSDEDSTTQISHAPSVGECAVHLELLEAFLVLKTKVLKSNALDRTFGIAMPAGKNKKVNITTIRERKWKGYVSLAVIRFEKWWQNIDRVLLAAHEEAGSSNVAAAELTITTLPPLDILLVWHTLMLNPKLYREICDKQCPDFWKVRLPWKAIHQVIEASSRAYSLPAAASELFHSITGLQSELFSFLADFSKLPDNARKILVLAEDRGISFSEYEELQGSLQSDPQDVMFRAFLERGIFALPRIKVDIKRYLENINGQAEDTFCDAFPQLNASDERYIGTLIKSAFHAQRYVNAVQGIESLKKKLNDCLSTSSFQKQNKISVADKLLCQQAIERWLSSYVTKTRGSEIEAAILRQGEFVEKMGGLLWIRSPALQGTLARGISRYEKFFQLLAAFPEKVIVPTLDIDLVWHTHQCSPSGYFAYTQALTGRFINHDDSIAKGDLKKALQGTKELFQLRFGEEYSRCLCWDCEAVLSAVEEALQMEAGQEEKLARRVTVDVAYFRAVEMARRNGKMLPIRNREALESK